MTKEPQKSARPVRKASAVNNKKPHTVELEDPGTIITEKTLTLHTKEALKIFKGRRADPENGIKDIPGLAIYGTMLRNIWGSALSGDLYAQWWIQKLEKNLKNSEADFARVQQELDGLKSKVADRIDLSKSEATDPVTVDVSYATPYMYLIVYRLIDVDHLIANLITLRHIAIINPAEFEQYRKNIAGSLQAVLLGLRGFKPTGVTVEDVEENNARYKDAISKLGELPDDIKSGKFVPEHMPRKSVKIFGFGAKKS